MGEVGGVTWEARRERRAGVEDLLRWTSCRSGDEVRYRRLLGSTTCLSERNLDQTRRGCHL